MSQTWSSVVAVSMTDAEGRAIIEGRRAAGEDITDPVALMDPVRFLEAEAEWSATMATETEPSPRRSRSTPHNWADFMARDLTQVDWIAGKIMERGQLIAMVGDGKAGKSILSQEWAWRAAAGLPFLGDKPRKPIRTLYGDLENADSDVQERMMSYGATAETLANLVYLPFPAWRPLDTREGGEDLLADVEEHSAELVFLDTISRMIKGKENDADTWLDLYRYTLARLKRRGVSVVRLDHFGKDKDRGARGGSAKRDDVDQVWELTAQGGGLLRMKRTHTRNGHGDDDMTIRRLGRTVNDRWVAGETRHVLAADEQGNRSSEWIGARKIADQLDAAGIPRDAGRDRVKVACAKLAIKASTAMLVEVVKVRKGGENLSGTGAGSGDDEPDLWNEDRSV